MYSIWVHFYDAILAGKRGEMTLTCCSPISLMRFRTFSFQTYSFEVRFQCLKLDSMYLLIIYITTSILSTPLTWGSYSWYDFRNSNNITSWKLLLLWKGFHDELKSYCGLHSPYFNPFYFIYKLSVISGTLVEWKYYDRYTVICKIPPLKITNAALLLQQ